MNVLIINDYGIQGGGTEVRIKLFVNELLRRNLVTEIHIVQYFNNTSTVEYKDKPVFFHTIRNHSYIEMYRGIKQYIKEYNITLVQAHNLLAIKPYVLVAAKQAKVPVVWMVHDYWLLCANRSFIDPINASEEKLCRKSSKKKCSSCMDFKTRMKYAFWRYIMNYVVDHAIAPAKILQEIHEHNNVVRGKWSVVVPWIDPYFFDNNEKNKEQNRHIKKHIILFVGSLIEFKGAWVAAKAMKKICAAFPQAKLVFVGGEQEKEGLYRRNIEAIVARDGTRENILFFGKKTKEEIRELQRDASAYICPTVCMESFGLNWAEAMASGCPVIASTIGSIPEYIKNEESGVLFPSKDHEALADSVIKLFKDTKRAKQLAENGQAYAEKQFRVERATDEILEIYKRLL